MDNTSYLPVLLGVFFILAVILFVVLYTLDQNKNARRARAARRAPGQGSGQPGPGAAGVSGPGEQPGAARPSAAASASAGTAAVPVETGGTAAVAAASDTAAKPAPTPPETTSDGGGTFYVFVSQGRALAAPAGGLAEAINEKARALKDACPQAGALRLAVLEPGQWEGADEKAAGGDAGSTGLIRAWLLEKGVAEAAAEAGLAESAQQALRLTNIGTGLSFVGVPVRKA